MGRCRQNPGRRSIRHRAMSASSQTHAVHIVLDLSNVFIAGKYVAARRDGLHGPAGFRLQFESLKDLARAGRPIAGVYAAGSGLPEDHPLWARARAAGFDIDVLERGRESQTEQGVDATIQCKLLRALLDADEPGVLVLIT